MKNIKKYFIVAYTATLKESSSSFSIGNVTITNDKCYLNQKETIRSIKDSNPNFNSVIITNIIELTLEQYEHWVS